MTALSEKTPLWRQLQAVSQVVARVRAGESGTAVLETVPVDLRPGVQALSFQVWRNLGRATALRQLLAPRKPAPAADALLCAALALLWDDSNAHYDAFTLVNQTVEAAKRTKALEKQANFINACLRRFLREKVDLIVITDKDPQARWNHPLWWIERLRKDHPAQWESILKAANQHAPMTLRVNVRQSSVASYLKQLEQSGVTGKTVGDTGIELDQAVPVHALPGFSEGRVSVQDAAAQMAAPLLLSATKQGAPLRILDACAAPGGKTGHLLELCNADVLALEVDPRRSQRITETLSRLGLQAAVQTADAARPDRWWDGKPFDAILLDAPCTASGIVRRHPDVRWLRRETDIAQLAALQKKMLQNLWPLLATGGSLLYCTCSVFREEGSTQVQTFLAHNTDARVLPSPGHLIPQNGTKAEHTPDNQSINHDGFFYALLQKQPA